MNTLKGKTSGHRSVMQVRHRQASHVEAGRAEAAIDRLLAELVRQERGRGRSENDSRQQQW